MSDVAIQNAVRDLLIGISPAIVPQTTVTTATQGAASITVVDGSQFTRGGLVGFVDALGEEMLPVGSVAGNVVTFDFTGLGYTGLQHTHTADTAVYTNIDTEEGTTSAAMLAKGLPALFVWVSGQDSTKRGLSGLKIDSYTVQIEYHRGLVRPEDSPMHPRVWWNRQMKAARADLATIAATVEGHALLSGNATMLGKIGGSAYRRLRWKRPPMTFDTDQIAVRLEVDVTGGFTHMTP